MLDDDVEAVVGTEPGGHAHLRVEGADIGLDRARGHAGGAGRAVEAGADPALDSQRRLVDRDRDPGQHERAAARSDQLDSKVEAGAEARAGRAGGRRCGSGRRPSVRSITVPARMSPIGIDLADHRRDPVGLGAADAGALEHSGEAVAAAQSGAKVDDRPLGAFGQRLDRVGRRHPAAGVGAEAERRDGERARFLELGVRKGVGEAPGSGSRLGAKRPGGVAERGAGDEAAEPFAPSRSAGRDRRPGRARRRGARKSWPRWPKDGRAGRRTVERRCRAPAPRRRSPNRH